jgi:hypothetical protein
MNKIISPTCKICGRKPEDISEYREGAFYMGITPNEYVRIEEGTYNTETKKFYCTSCYIKIGMPLGKA